MLTDFNEKEKGKTNVSHISLYENVRRIYYHIILHYVLSELIFTKILWMLTIAMRRCDQNIDEAQKLIKRSFLRI